MVDWAIVPLFGAQLKVPGPDPWMLICLAGGGGEMKVALISPLGYSMANLLIETEAIVDLSQSISIGCDYLRGRKKAGHTLGVSRF